MIDVAFSGTCMYVYASRSISVVHEHQTNSLASILIPMQTELRHHLHDSLGSVILYSTYFILFIKYLECSQTLQPVYKKNVAGEWHLWRCVVVPVTLQLDTAWQPAMDAFDYSISVPFQIHFFT